MWTVFGIQVNLVEVGRTWKDQLIELSRRKKGRPRFMEMIKKAEVSYHFDSARNLHVFQVQLPERYGPEDVDFMKDFVLKVIKSTKEPAISLLGKPQKYTVIITSEIEKDVYRGMTK